MSIQFLHPGRVDKTMDCSIYHGQRTLLFSCSQCQAPVCADCGLLEFPDPLRLVALILDLKNTEVAGSPLAIDIEEWIAAPDDPRQRFLCPNCQPEDVLEAAREAGRKWEEGR